MGSELVRPGMYFGELTAGRYQRRGFRSRGWNGGRRLRLGYRGRGNT